MFSAQKLISSAINFAHLLGRYILATAQGTTIPQKSNRSERSIRAPTKSQIPLSPRSVSAINLQITASHEAARIADAEDSRTSVLLWHTQLAQHVLRRPVAPALGVLLEQSLHHGGRNVAGRDGVYANAITAPFGSEVATQLEDGGLGGVVGWADEALVENVRKTL